MRFAAFFNLFATLLGLMFCYLEATSFSPDPMQIVEYAFWAAGTAAATTFCFCHVAWYRNKPEQAQQGCE